MLLSLEPHFKSVIELQKITIHLSSTCLVFTPDVAQNFKKCDITGEI